MTIVARERAARRVPRTAAVAAVAVVTLLASACSGGGHSKGPAKAAAATTRAHVTITPANGTANADPSAGIAVTATDGKLTNVTVQTAGDPVPGTRMPVSNGEGS